MPMPRPKPLTIDFDAAVAKGKELAKKINTNLWELGKLADEVEAKYGETTIEHLAKDIGMEHPQVLVNLRATYRAWKDIPKDKSRDLIPFNTLRVLNAHPEREEIAALDPPPTKREAEQAVKHQMTADEVIARREIRSAYGEYIEAVLKKAQHVERQIQNVAKDMDPRGVDEYAREIVKELKKTLQNAADKCDRLIGDGDDHPRHRTSVH
jgi:hypothetical protein